MPCTASVAKARARFRTQSAARLAETIPELRAVRAGCTGARARADITKLIRMVDRELRRRAKGVA